MKRPLAPILALIPARGGSKGLPGKNIRPLAGLPLIAHSIKFALMCPDVTAVFCSTDSEEIAVIAKEYGAEVPFLRPSNLATDTTSMWDVVQHSLTTLEQIQGRMFGSILLLAPTNPGRTVEDISSAVAKLHDFSSADGVVSVSEPNFNPIWHCVVEEAGLMRDLLPEGRDYTRRQDLPRVFRINGSFYLWRRDFILSSTNWRDGRMVMQQTPESRSVDIDTLEDFEEAARALKEGKISFPWVPS